MTIKNPFTCFECAVLEPSAMLRLDPLITNGAIIECVAPFTEPVTLHVDSAPVLKLTPTDSSKGQGVGTTLSLYSAIVNDLGVEDDGAAADVWTGEGVEAMRAVLAKRPTSPLALWRGEATAIVAQAENMGRSFGLSPKTIEGVTGRPFEVRKLLLPAGRHAARLDQAARLEAERLARLEAERLAVEAEARRLRTPRELGASVVYLKAGALSTCPSLLGSLETLYTDDAGGRFLAWEQIPGWPLPDLETDSLRVWGADELLPPIRLSNPGQTLPRIRAATSDVARWVSAVRCEAEAAFLGAVDAFGDAGVEPARALIDRHRRLFYATVGDQMWRRTVIAECVVRGLRVRPDLAAAMILQAIDAEHKSHAPQPFFIPAYSGNEGAQMITTSSRSARFERAISPDPIPFPISVWARDDIERVCVQAASTGTVDPGALLSQEQTPKLPTPSRIHTSSKHYRTADATAE